MGTSVRADRAERARVLFVRNGHPHDVASRIAQGKNLSDAGFHVARLSCCHTLHGDLPSAEEHPADADVPDHLLPSSSSFFSIIFCNSLMNEEMSLNERYTEA